MAASLPENEGSPAPSDLLDIIQVTPGTSTDYYYYPELVALDDGSLLMLSSQCCWPLYSQVSSDGGLTWSDPVRILEEAGFPDAIQDSEGVIWLVYQRWNGTNHNIFLRTSADGGDTWSEERPVAADPDIHEEYPSIARTPTGRLVAAYYYGGAVYYSVSDDGGDTWSEAAILDDQSAYYPDLAVAPDGALWAVYNECCWRVYYRASSDDGETWSERQLLAENGILPSVDFSGPEVLASYYMYDCFSFTCTYDIWYVGHTRRHRPGDPRAVHCLRRPGPVRLGGCHAGRGLRHRLGQRAAPQGWRVRHPPECLAGGAGGARGPVAPRGG